MKIRRQIKKPNLRGFGFFIVRHPKKSCRFFRVFGGCRQLEAQSSLKCNTPGLVVKCIIG